MEVITIDGQKFVKASIAARQAGYTADYVGQLARSGAVPARLVGRTWYVDADVLRTHRVEKKRAARVKAREQVKQVLAERQSQTNQGSRWESRAVSRYEGDHADLMPTVKKAAVEMQASTKQEMPEEPAVIQYVEEEENERTDYKAVAVRPMPTVSAQKKDSRATSTLRRQVIVPRKQITLAPEKKATHTLPETKQALVRKRTAQSRKSTSEKPKRRFPFLGSLIFVLALLVGMLLPIFEVRHVYHVVGQDRSSHIEYVVNIGAVLSKEALSI